MVNDALHPGGLDADDAFWRRPWTPFLWNTGQPMDGAGYVWAQVGWIDECGDAYDLQANPDNLPAGLALKPLYVNLGRTFGDQPATGPLAEECA